MTSTTQPNPTRCLAEIEARRGAWAAAHGLRESTGAACPRRLARRPCRLRAHGTCACARWWADHATLWLGEAGRPVVWLAQPYALGEDAMREVLALCAELGLEAEVTSDSWWYPGRTVALVLRPAGKRA